KWHLVFGQPSHRILGGEQAMETSLRVFQCGFHGVPAVKDDGAVAVMGPAVPGRRPRVAGPFAKRLIAGLLAGKRPALVAPGLRAGMTAMGIALTHARVVSRQRWLGNFVLSIRLRAQRRPGAGVASETGRPKCRCAPSALRIHQMV